MGKTAAVETTTAPKARRITDNKELVAIDRVDRILSALTSEERGRVMAYIGQKVNEEQQREYLARMQAEEARYANQKQAHVYGDVGRAVQIGAGSLPGGSYGGSES